MILISVEVPLALQSGKSNHVYFKRALQSDPSVSVDLESIVRVLHVLYMGVPHEVVIKYQYE